MIEKDENYCKIIKERLNKIRADRNGWKDIRKMSESAEDCIKRTEEKFSKDNKISLKDIGRKGKHNYVRD